MDEWLGHPIKALFPFCLTILAVTLTAMEPVRTWTSADGRTLQAQYIESSAGKVTIKMGSREYTLPLSRFSQADQDYVAGLANQPPPAYQPITKAEPRDARKFYREEDDWEGYLLGGGDSKVAETNPPPAQSRQSLRPIIAQKSPPVSRRAFAYEID